MTKLIRLGFFKEMPHGELTDNSIKEYIGRPNYGSDKNKVLNYLRSGAVLINCCGTTDDIVNPGKGIAGVPSYLTDGKWVWPGDLAYYVEVYNVTLDASFLSYMSEMNWEINKSAIVFEDLEL